MNSARAQQLSVLTGAVLAVAATGSAGAPAVGTESAEGLALAAHHPVDARQIYQIEPHRQGDRWYLYLGHLRGSEMNPRTGRVEQNGSSVVDVTDPRHPELLIHIPPTDAPWFDGENPIDRSGGQHVQACSGDELPGGVPGRHYLLRNQGMIGDEVLDVTNPREPTLVSQVVRTAPARDGLYRTHKNVWDCGTGEAYLVTSVEGWTGQVMQVFDLADPTAPRHIRDFGLPGTQPGGSTHRGDGFSLHEPTVYRDRVYMAYGTDHHGVIQILDRQKLLEGNPDSADPLAPTDENLRYPEIARMDMPDFWGAHSAKPILDVPIADYAKNKVGSTRDFLFATSEGIDFLCETPRHLAFFIDITDVAHPWPVSNYQVPALPPASGGPDFCERGVFGPHSPHASHNPLYEGRILFLSYFTGGVRVLDMRDPFKPVEVGHYIAEITPNSRVIYPPDAGPDVVAWPVANTVEVDERGDFIFMADRPHNGLYILELTGTLKALATGR